MPEFLDRSGDLIDTLGEKSPADIQELMGVSQTIAELTHSRVMNWHAEMPKGDARQSILAFKGDVYAGLEADTLDSRDLGFAQDRLRILSGLYGLLRPLDLMLPYRLEMGTRLTTPAGDNLYQFWGDELTLALNDQLAATRGRVLVNLASNEYFKAVKPALLNADVVTPVFKDLKNGRYKVLSFFAKKARGMMARFIIKERLKKPEGMKDFSSAGYRYADELSTASEWVFTRDKTA